MVRSVERDALESDIPTAVDLLVGLINGCGPIRIIIDGLDEIDEFERTILLRQVLKISGDCSNASVLISSRSEDNIAALLGGTSTCIDAVTRNTSSIKVFFKSRLCEWLQGRTFSTAELTEINNLMDGIADQAKGTRPSPSVCG